MIYVAPNAKFLHTSRLIRTRSFIMPASADVLALNGDGSSADPGMPRHVIYVMHQFMHMTDLFMGMIPVDLILGEYTIVISIQRPNDL